MIILVFTTCSAFSQTRLGFFLPDGARKVEIPFEQYNNLVVIPVTINDFITLRFILDTGAESVILTERIFAELLGLNFVRSISLQAPGVEDSLRAFVASDVEVALPGGVRGLGLNMLVLEEDYLELSKNLGEEVYGILGYEIFSRFAVEIDYDKNVLTLHDPKKMKKRYFGTRIPLSLEGPKPYINMVVQQGNKEDSVKLMVDTGASHAVLLDLRKTDNIELPENLIPARLGQGLGGEIPGYIGRFSSCILSEYQFDDVLVSMPAQGAYIKAIKRGSRHGTLGGDIISRFNVTFDYSSESIFLRKGKDFKDDFEFDMSGLTIGAEGDNLDSLVVIKVRENSPAEAAGIRAGDYIYKINGRNLSNSKLSDVNALLRRKHGLKIKVVLIRNGERVKKFFKLERVI